MTAKRALIILIICLVPRVVFLGYALSNNDYDAGRLLWDDAKEYHALACHIADRPAWFFEKNSGPYQFRKELYVPAYPIFLAFFFKLFGPDILMSVILNIMFFCLCVFLLYGIGTSLFNEKVGFISAIILSAYPTLITVMTLPYAESPFIFLLLLGLYLFILFMKTERTLYLSGSAASFAMAFMTKEVAIFIPLVITVLIVMRFERRIRRSLTSIAVFFLVYLLIIVPCCMRNQYKYGLFAPSQFVGIYLNHVFWTVQSDIVRQATCRKAAEASCRHWYAPLVSFCMERKQLLWGMGTISILRSAGYNTRTISAAINDPGVYLGILYKTSRRLFVYHIGAWCFTGFIYLLSITGFFLLSFKRKVMPLCINLFMISYFILAYSFHYNARYFSSIVPFLSLLAAYAITAGIGRIKKGMHATAG